METSVLRRRVPLSEAVPRPLTHRLIVLLRSYTEMRPLCTTTSLALRVLALTDMALRGALVLTPLGTVTLAQSGRTELEQDIAQRVAGAALTPQRLLAVINGEKGRSKAVHRVRSRICKEMVAAGLIRVSKGAIYSRVTVCDHAEWLKEYKRLLEDCQAASVPSNNPLPMTTTSPVTLHCSRPDKTTSAATASPPLGNAHSIATTAHNGQETHSLATTALLLALEYINRMESVLLQCNTADAAAVVERMRAGHAAVANGTARSPAALVYEFLKCILRK